MFSGQTKLADCCLAIQLVNLEGLRPTWKVSWQKEPNVPGAARAKGLPYGYPRLGLSISLQLQVKVAATGCLAKLHPQTLPFQPRTGWDNLLVQLTAKQVILSLWYAVMGSGIHRSDVKSNENPKQLKVITARHLPQTLMQLSLKNLCP